MKTFAYQNHREYDYFEGWYVRVIDQAQGINRSIIFACTKSTTDPHAFLQLFSYDDEAPDYIRYPLEAFQVDGDTITMGPNRLSPTRIVIEEERFSCDLTIHNPVTLASQFGTQSAMSFVSWFRLQTNQEVVYLNADLTGSLRVLDHAMTINGSTYIEKTYGHKFPPGHIWLQSAHFDVPDTYFSMSIGVVPLLGISTKGWFAVLRHDKDEYRFAIYNLAKLSIKHANQRDIELEIKRGRFRLEVLANRTHWVNLVGPTDGAVMSQTVPESIDATIVINLYFDNQLVLNTKGILAGFENTF
jgi:tocopherol cyclase